MVQQHVLDALGRWAGRATGRPVIHGRTNVERPAVPYVVLEWRGRPAAKTPRYVHELAEAPLGGRLVLTALEGGDVVVTVNLARARLVRDVGETLAQLAARVVAALSAPLSGRVAVVVDGDDVVATPQAPGDLWRVEALVGATASYEGGTAPARIADRVWSSSVRVRVVGGRTTSGEAGVAGDGRGASELLAELQDSLDEEWAIDLLESFGVRRSEEATEARAEERRVGATLEDRSYFDLVLGVSTRYALRAEPATAIVASVSIDQDPPPQDNPVDQVISDG